MELRKNGVLQVLVTVAFLTVFASVVCASETIVDGAWKDSVSWLGKNIPGEQSKVSIKHHSVLKGGVKTGDIVIESGGVLSFSYEEGNVTLECGDIVIMPGGRLLIPESINSGCNITCKDVYTMVSPTDTGKFISDCYGLNMTCQTIRNEGFFKANTVNYLTVNGNIYNGARFEYPGNGLHLHGDSLIQTNPDGLLDIRLLSHQHNWSNPDQQFISFNPKPLNIGGMVRLNGCNVYAKGGNFVAVNDQSGFDMDGGSFVDVCAENMKVKGSHHFVAEYATLLNCTLEDTIESISSQMAGNTVINGVLHPRGMGLAYDNSASVSLIGNTVLNGSIADTSNIRLSVAVTGTFVNNGIINLHEWITGYDLPSIVNYGEISVKGLSMQCDTLHINNSKINYHSFSTGIVENNGVFHGDFVSDSTCLITSQTVGAWSGVMTGVTSKGFNPARFVGNHHFAASELTNFSVDKESVLTFSRTKLNQVVGDNTVTLMKSGCSMVDCSGLNTRVEGSLSLDGKNTGILTVRDSLLFGYASFVGELTTNGVVTEDPKSYGNKNMGVTGVWINNGSVATVEPYFYLSMTGTIVNNGTIGCNAYINGPEGQIIQNGVWNKDVYYNLKENDNGLFWMVKNEPSTMFVSLREQSNNMYNTKLTKNGVVQSNRYISNPTVADTGLYVIKAVSPGTYMSNFRISTKNPFGFIQPVNGAGSNDSILNFSWPKVLGATGYKVILNKISGSGEIQVAIDSTIQGDTTTTFTDLSDSHYKAYLSVKIGDSWSIESEPVMLNIATATGLQHDRALLTGSCFGIKQSDSYQIGIESTVEGKAQVRLLDLTGRVLFMSDVFVSKGLNRIDGLPALMPGVYLIDTEIQGSRLTGKLIME